MFRYFVFSLLLFITFSSCKSKDGRSVAEKSNFIIYLQPYDGITDDETQCVFTGLKKIYSFIEIKKSIPIPQSAYYSPRNRYRADSLINILINQVGYSRA